MTATCRLCSSLATAALLTLAVLAGPAGSAQAAPEWHLEQPKPPELEAGSPGSETPIGLGRIGDIQFYAPNRGLLITNGNGSTIPPGVWDYNGTGWHQLARVCGATDGRIAWAGPDEFWTISDGRPGQAANGLGLLPPLEDNTLCHFVSGSVAASYAVPGFQANSYMAMHAAACLSPTECWFAGDPLPTPQIGAFHLRWNGSSLEAEPNTRAEYIGDIKAFEGHLYESGRLPLEPSLESQSAEEIEHPTVLTEIAAQTARTFLGVSPRTESAGSILPEYASESEPQSLGFLHLSADSESMWAAAGPISTPPAGTKPGALTVLRENAGQWAQVLGPPAPSTIQVDPPGVSELQVSSVAAEPGSSSAWVAVDTGQDLKHPVPTLAARLLHVGADGSVTEVELPSAAERAEGVGAKGAAYRVTCPAANDCWLASTQGWLFHLAEEGSRTLGQDTDPTFNGPLITYRPADEGLPQVQADTPPPDTSGLNPAHQSMPVVKPKPQPFALTTLPLLTNVRSRLASGSTLEVSFHLAVKARIRLIAKRRGAVVASTPMRTLKAGRRSLMLRLDPHRWPNKLSLQTHALAPLPRVSSQSNGVETIGTSSFATPFGAATRGWRSSL
jgi:hypothetical protein